MMKINIFFRTITILHLIVFVLSVNAQIKTDTIKLPNNYKTSTKLIKLRPNVQSLILNNCDNSYCDTLYVFNKKKYNYYTLYKNSIKNDSIGLLVKKLEKEYAAYVKEQETSFSQLEEVYNKQTKIHKRQIDEVKTTLELNKTSIQLMRTSLEAANESVKHTQLLLKQKRRKDFFNKLTIAGTGIGVGILIGVLVN